MPRTLQRLRAFVASPSDTAEERELLGRVVSEINRSWADTLSLDIELVKWETHAYPSVDTDPQQVINTQIGDEYEIFIGIFWSRFGTPTPRAGSGTQEEFERAHSRFLADPKSVSLLFYFKEQPVALSKISPADIDRIQRFRASLGELGGLYWTFENLAEFEALVRVHLAKVIQVWKKRIQTYSGQSEAEDVSLRASQNVAGVRETEEFDTEVDELGYLDYMAMGEEAAAAMNSALEQMTSAMRILEINTTKRTDELIKLAENPNLSAVREVTDAMALDLESFAKSTEAEIPVFAMSFGNVLRAFSGAASIGAELSQGREPAANALSAIVGLRIALQSTKDLLKIFAESVARTPRMTKELNRARQGAIKVLASLDTEFEKALSNSSMLEDSIQSLLTVRTSNELA